jgi:hypothetical protein
MASIVSYTKRMFCERLSKHINDGWAGNDFKITTNELCLYIDAGIPYVMKGQMYENAKAVGVFETIDAYLVSYAITGLTKNSATNEWVAILPQTPLALPTGYNITDAYISDTSYGRGQSVFITQTKRVPYRANLPKPSGVFARVEYNKMYLQSYNGMSLLNQTLNVQMPISRTEDLDAEMNMPDDAIQPLFDYVIKQVASRYQLPNDIVADNLPAGNKSS